MKLKRLILALLICFPWVTACSASSQTSSPPTPVVKWPLDVSKQDSKVNQQFRIIEYRSYYFALRFDYDTKVSHDRIVADGQRVLALIDVDMSTMKHKGINIPIHIKISKLDTGSLPPELIYENTILTKGMYVAAFGNYRREIIEIDLKPGIYRVEANTIENRPEFSGTPSYLQIEGHSNIKFLPGSIK
jgi:hypothetical protein